MIQPMKYVQSALLSGRSAHDTAFSVDAVWQNTIITASG